MPVKTAFMADHKGEIRRSSAVLYGGLRVEGEAEHKNSGEQIECISILKGFGECDGIPVHPGMAVILLPGEMMTDATLTDMVAARLRKGRTDRGVCRMDDRINKRT